MPIVLLEVVQRQRDFAVWRIRDVEADVGPGSVKVEVVDRVNSAGIGHAIYRLSAIHLKAASKLSRLNISVVSLSMWFCAYAVSAPERNMNVEGYGKELCSVLLPSIWVEHYKATATQYPQNISLPPSLRLPHFPHLPMHYSSHSLLPPRPSLHQSDLSEAL